MKRIVLVLFIASSAAAQAPKNLKVLTPASPVQLQREMNVMRAALGVHCDYCHVAPDAEGKGEWDFASDAKPKKETGRSMIKMTKAINDSSFHGQPVITCYTCHQGHLSPTTILPLPTPEPPFPTPIEDRKSWPSAADLVAKYVTAVGGEKAAARLAATSRTMTGTRIAGENKLPFDLQEADGRAYVKIGGDAPLEQSFGPDGGWMRNAKGVQPMRPDQAESLRDVYPAFEPFDPAMLNKDARVVAKEKLNGHEAWVVSDKLDDSTRVRVWFDAVSGLALRRTILLNSEIGRVPRQSDFDDYREADGVKVPFEVRFSSPDPWISATRKYTAIHLGAPVDAAVFAQPK
jgi:hypothetical protein